MPQANRPMSPIIAPANPGDSSLDQFISGMNAGGCNAGLGICTAVQNPKADDWSRDVRDPQPSGYLGWGGDSVEPGQEDADIPDLKVVDYLGPDFNDTVAFIQATQAATNKGDTVAVGYVLASTPAVPVQIGDWVWAAKSVA